MQCARCKTTKELKDTHLSHSKNRGQLQYAVEESKRGTTSVDFFFACFKDFFLWLFLGDSIMGQKSIAFLDYCISSKIMLKLLGVFLQKMYGSFLYSPLSFFFGKSFYFSVFSVLVWEWRATNQLIRSHPPTAASPPKKEREKGGERNSLECFGRANAATVHVNSDLW